jgi:hypothetical protein
VFGTDLDEKNRPLLERCGINSIHQAAVNRGFGGHNVWIHSTTFKDLKILLKTVS